MMHRPSRTIGSLKVFVLVSTLAALPSLGGVAAVSAQASGGGGGSGSPGGALSCDNPDLNFEVGEYPSELTLHTGNAVEPESGRPYFLDFPCGLEAGEEVTVVLNLHGGGSLANWQRHYFPIYRFKDEYRLIVATPDAGEPGPGTWDEETDYAYIRGVVEDVYDRFSDQDISAFWFAGHSYGGLTTRRLVCTDFYRDRTVGFVSLSGGRVGSPRPGRDGEISPLPECDFSHVFTAGEHETSGGSVAATSRWAERYDCDARVRQLNVIDTRPGLVYDNGRQDPGSDSWGRLPRPGVSQWYVYPGCEDGRVVADLIRIDKGHTEGLEENVTEQIVQLIMAGNRAANR